MDTVNQVGLSKRHFDIYSLIARVFPRVCACDHHLALFLRGKGRRFGRMYCSRTLMKSHRTINSCHKQSPVSSAALNQLPRKYRITSREMRTSLLYRTHVICRVLGALIKYKGSYCPLCTVHVTNMESTVVATQVDAANLSRMTIGQHSHRFAYSSDCESSAIVSWYKLFKPCNRDVHNIGLFVCKHTSGCVSKNSERGTSRCDLRVTVCLYGTELLAHREHVLYRLLRLGKMRGCRCRIYSVSLPRRRCVMRALKLSTTMSIPWVRDAREQRWTQHSSPPVSH